MKSDGRQIQQLHGGFEVFCLCEAISKDYLLVQNDCQPYICIQRREGKWGTCFFFQDTIQKTGRFWPMELNRWPEPTHMVMPSCRKVLETWFSYWVILCPVKYRVCITIKRKRSRMVNEEHILVSTSHGQTNYYKSLKFSTLLDALLKIILMYLIECLCGGSLPWRPLNLVI